MINPDGLKNQIEGNVIQSLSRTLHEEVTFDTPHVTGQDWQGYPILRFEDIPDNIDVVLVTNRPQYPSYGAGEPSTNPTAAVISNAVFDEIGVRLRQTPVRPERIKAAASSWRPAGQNARLVLPAGAPRSRQWRMTALGTQRLAIHWRHYRTALPTCG